MLVNLTSLAKSRRIKAYLPSTAKPIRSHLCHLSHFRYNQRFETHVSHTGWYIRIRVTIGDIQITQCCACLSRKLWCASVAGDGQNC